MRDLREALLEALEDPQLFRSYLEAQPMEAVVGRSINGYHCPLARYLCVRLEQPLGVPLAAVNRMRITIERANQRASVDTPLWAARFIQEVDENISDYDVTRERAVEILDKIEQVAHP